MNCFDAKLSNERMLSKWKIIEKVFDDNYLAFLKKIITNFDCGNFETHVCFVLILTNMLHFPWDVPQVLRNVVTTLKFYLCKFYVRKFTEICMVTYTPKNYDRNGKKMITKLLMKYKQEVDSFMKFQSLKRFLELFLHVWKIKCSMTNEEENSYNFFNWDQKIRFWQEIISLTFSLKCS